MRSAICAGLLCFSAILGWSIVETREPYVPEARITYRPIQVRQDGYVSSDTCKACHPVAVRRLARLVPPHDDAGGVTPETVRADFDGVRVTDVPGTPDRRSSGADASSGPNSTIPTGTAQGSERPRIKRQIVMITGSHHQQVYWYRTDRTPRPRPAARHVPHRRTAMDSAATPPSCTRRPRARLSETGRWNAVCINCHATHGKRQLDAIRRRGSRLEPIDGRHDGGRVRHRVRGVPRPERRARAGEPEPAAPLLAAPDRRAPTRRIVQPTRLTARCRRRSAASVTASWDHYDRAGGTAARTRAGCRIGRGRSRQDALRRAADAEPRLAD